jgi:hypothetical protein
MGHTGKQVVQEGSDEDDVPLAQRKRKVGASAQSPRGRVTVHLVAPFAKVTMPVPSKLINRMITMMTMKTSPWTRSRPLSLGPQDLLVRQLQWVSSRRWITQGGLTMCTKNGTPIPLFGKMNFDADI